MTNLELANKLRDLRDFLIIAGYEESHALRYTHIARAIEKWPESVEDMARTYRLTEIPQVGKLISQYIKEIVQTGASSKQHDWEDKAPFSVVEMCHVKGLGPKTARQLWEGHSIANFKQLKVAVEEGKLNDVLSERVRKAVVAHEEPEQSV